VAASLIGIFTAIVAFMVDVAEATISDFKTGYCSSVRAIYFPLRSDLRVRSELSLKESFVKAKRYFGAHKIRLAPIVQLL
jgi:hypothetical protein